MDSRVEKTKKRYKAFGIFTLAVFGIFLAGFVYLESQSPAYLFVNDTNASMQTGIVAQTSPAVRINLEPGEKKFVDMPSWWHADFGRGDSEIKPRYNFIVFQIFYLSDFSTNE